MKNKSSQRIENKKKKLAALLAVSKLNECDRNKTQTSEPQSSAHSESEPSLKKPRTKSPNKDNDDKPKLSGAEFLELKKMLRERSRKLRQQPLFRLRDPGAGASLRTELEQRVPLFLSDLQHLIMYSQLGHHTPYSPARWCSLEKFNNLSATSLLVVENVTMHDFVSNEREFPFICSTFDNKLEVLAARDVVRDMSMVPLTGSQMRKFVDEFGSLEEAVVKTAEVFDVVQNLFPIDAEPETKKTSGMLPHRDSFPRTQLLLSGWQMVEENYPLPVHGLMKSKYAGYVLTKDAYRDVNARSPMFGLDCEMCKTSCGDLELTRVSVVDEECNTFYDTLVKPDNKITDYLTRFSGITHKMMKNVKTKLQDVQEDLRKMLPEDAILVGHSLGSDLHALKMMHPYVIDTSVVYNLTGDRCRKTKLKTLAHEFMSQRIQEGKSGHCSTEDSIASLKLAQFKLSKTLYFGDAVMGSVHNERNYADLGTFNYATSMLKQTTKIEKTASIVAAGDVLSKYKYYVDKGAKYKGEEDKSIGYFSERGWKDVIKKMCDCMDKYSLQIGHVNFREEDSSELFKSIDKCVTEIYEKMPPPGLVVVLFAGVAGSNGCCFVQLKNTI